MCVCVVCVVLCVHTFSTHAAYVYISSYPIPTFHSNLYVRRGTKA